MRFSALEAAVARLEAIYFRPQPMELVLELTAAPGEDFKRLEAYCRRMNSYPPAPNCPRLTLVAVCDTSLRAKPEETALSWAPDPPRPAADVQRDNSAGPA